jgi:hypothetical protein
MRLAIFTATLFSLCFGASAATVPGTATNPVLKLTQETKDGTIRVTLKNISKKPISAFVVALDDGTQSKTTHHKYYGGRTQFEPGKTVDLVFAVHTASTAPNVFVDFVRLSDGSAWGSAVTDAGKDVAASFEK